MGRMDGKVCIVTGGALGLGKADATALAREGAIVVITDVNTMEGAATVAELGERAEFVQHDVREEEQWTSIIAGVLQRHGRLDVLVNNAGVIRFEDIETATIESWRFVQGVNVEGTFLGCKHAIPAMRASGGGSIVNVSSTAAIQGYAGASAYVASKGAVAALTRSIAMHCMLKGDSIRCNSVHPHNAESPMSLGAYDLKFGHLPESERPKRGLVSPEGVANAVLFLASDESSDLNGTMLNLDRGTAIIPGAIPEP
jgi:3(or 17)beta-hydroxysteroid dehydrogenase